LGQLGQGPQRLVDQLRTAYERWHIAGGNRLATATTAAALAQALNGADGVQTVEVLASLDPPTSPTALGLSLTTAGAVADALAHTNWQLLELAGEGIGSEIVALLQADEIARPYADERRSLEQAATTWLQRHRPPTLVAETT